MVKNLPANAGDVDLIPGSGISPGRGNGNLLYNSCLENPKDRGAWWATVQGVAKSWTQLSTQACNKELTIRKKNVKVILSAWAVKKGSGPYLGPSGNSFLTPELHDAGNYILTFWQAAPIFQHIHCLISGLKVQGCSWFCENVHMRNSH